MEKINRYLEALHEAPQMLVFEFAGAGVMALMWLHSIGGSSRTVLEATDRYSPRSMAELLRYEPRHFTSMRTARAMATRAFFRANYLVEGHKAVLGVSCTAAIATDRVKKGKHQAFVSVCDAHGLMTYVLTMAKGTRTRQQEEELVSRLVLRAIGEAFGLHNLPSLTLRDTDDLEEDFQPTSLLERLISTEIEWLVVEANGHLITGERLPGIAIMPGSFNPLHTGHRKLAAIAEEMTGRTLYFELSLYNADKAAVRAAEVRRRLNQFADYAPVLLTHAPLFSQKVRFFPNSTFIVGVDTALRLVQLRFYHNRRSEMEAAFDIIRSAGCDFLVAGRMHNGQFMTLSDITIPEPFRDLFHEIPPETFRYDISSTEIRERSAN